MELKGQGGKGVVSEKKKTAKDKQKQSGKQKERLVKRNRKRSKTRRNYRVGVISG